MWLDKKAFRRAADAEQATGCKNLIVHTPPDQPEWWDSGPSRHEISDFSTYKGGKSKWLSRNAELISMINWDGDEGKFRMPLRNSLEDCGQPIHQ